MCFKKATQEKTGAKTRVLGLNISCCIVGAEKEVINARYCAAATLAEAPRLARVLHDVLTHILEHLQLLRRQFCTLVPVKQANWVVTCMHLLNAAGCKIATLCRLPGGSVVQLRVVK
jgi:hypothetical protein